MKNLIFYLIIGLLFTHELDAISKHEWRVLPLTSWMSDSSGYLFFLFAHIPLFAVLTALSSWKDEKIKSVTRLSISVFVVIHSITHLLFSENRNYEFNTLHSNFLIFGAGLAGFIYLLTDYSERKASKQ